MDMLEIQNALWAEGYNLLCGVDEAGRGPLAGPVYAAAVILPRGEIIEGINDSKKLSAARREELFAEITASALTYGIACASAREIDEMNILNATFLAMNRAIALLDPAPELSLVDGNQVKGIEYPCRAYVKGDERCAVIAAASILAKVSRDKAMEEIARQYPQYGFEKHKAYGTQAHYEALFEHGPCPEHRQSFLKKYYAKGGKP